MKPVTVDLFAGAGGLSEGLKQAGFNIALANEHSEWAIETYSHNHPATILLRKDIEKVSSSSIMRLIKEKPLLIAGGPPCQGFSMAGRRDIKDPRNHMLFEFLRIVKETRPLFVLVENVTGLLTFLKGRVVQQAESYLINEGYKVSKRTLNSVDFGVPQRRNRLFLFGSLKKDCDINDMAIRKSKIVTAQEAISDLDFLDAGQESEIYMKKPQSKYQKLMRRRSSKLHNHLASNHTDKIIKRFSYIKPGMKYHELKMEKKTKKRNMMRISPDLPIKTITTIPDDYIHYSLNRTLTVRESARFQGFVDTYIFLGSRTTGGLRRRVESPQYTQVGNAVPPPMGKAIGKWILDQV